MQKPLKHAKNIKISAPWLISLGSTAQRQHVSGSHRSRAVPGWRDHPFGDLHGTHGVKGKIPSIKIRHLGAIENGHRNSGFTHEKGWFSLIFHSYVNVDQRICELEHSEIDNCWVLQGGTQSSYPNPRLAKQWFESWMAPLLHDGSCRCGRPPDSRQLL